MTASPLRTPASCLKRALEFKADAEALRALPSQWFAVAYFYAAYQIVRASLMQDPIFDDLSRLQAVRPTWITTDRFNDHHKARRGTASPQGPGVSDMVTALYNDISVEYARLHGASIAVRYGLGLQAYDADVLSSDFDIIAAAAKTGLAA